MGKPGIAIWSVGEHVRRNLVPALFQCRSWRFVGCYSRNLANTQVVGKSGARVFRDPGEMLEAPSVDAVLIASPNGVHEHQIRAVLDAGKSALVEKTFCPDYRATEALLALAAERGVLAAECFMYLYHPQFAAARALVQNRDVMGRITSVTARFGFPHLAPGNIRYRADLSGGALLDAGAYCLSALSHLAVDETSFTWAEIERLPDYEVDTGGVAALQLGCGISGIADWGFGRAYRNEIEIWGERASVFVDRAFSKPVDMTTHICIRHQKDNREEIVTIDPCNHFIRMLDVFAAALEDPVERERLAAEVLAQAVLVRDAARIGDSTRHG